MGERFIRRSHLYYLLIFLSISIFAYFYFIGDYIIKFQEKQSLFIFSPEYFIEYLEKPGGILELTGKFLTQFYFNTLLGAIIISVSITIPGIILLFINEHLDSGSPLSILYIITPSLLLVLMQNHYYHFIEYNLGFISLLLCFLFSIIPKKSLFRYLTLLLFPLYYYLTGGYIWIYLCMYIIYSLSYNKGNYKFSHPFFLLILVASTLLASKKLLFLQPTEKLILNPLSFINNSAHRICFSLLTGYLLLFPLLNKVSVTSKIKWLSLKFSKVILIITFLILTIYFLIKTSNPQTAQVIRLEASVFTNKWDEVITMHEKYPSHNLIGQYFYNLALSETDQLCNRLLTGEQDFGANSLFLPWKNDYLKWGAYFYYSIGLINEAQRWAYEEMVVYGYRPQNLQMLIKTNLLCGNYIMAEKYINILKKTIYYNGEAKECEKLLNDPELIKLHPELGEKIKLLPDSDFFVYIDEPQKNLPLILESNPKNKKVYEYLMAWFLLNKDIEALMGNIIQMKHIGYTVIPKHIEEAILIYYDIRKIFPDLYGFRITSETKLRFENYVETYIGLRQNSTIGKEKMSDHFKNTFWYYFHFKSLLSD